jgi:hypothetical protein
VPSVTDNEREKKGEKGREGRTLEEERDRLFVWYMEMDDESSLRNKRRKRAEEEGYTAESEEILHHMK